MKTVIIVGAGPCGLFVATNLVKNKNLKIILYDQMSGAGKKFLIAGKSGLNLTHSEESSKFTDKYFDHKDLFDEWFLQFNNADLVKWVNELGIDTFVGTSGRVFPKDFKAAKMLKIWMDGLKENTNFEFYPNSKCNGFDSDSVIINSQSISYDHLVFAMGGKSWSKTGSDGIWSNYFEQNGIELDPFYQLNCGFNIDWNSGFFDEMELLPIKYIELSYGDHKIRGDIMLTKWGVEGSPVYYLSHSIITTEQSQKLYIDFKPDLSIDEIEKKLTGKKSNSTKLKQILSVEAQVLIKELTTKEEFLNPRLLAEKIKKVILPINSPRPIEEAISTGGGVSMKEVNSHLELSKIPNVYIGGEMLAWGAPTGGYLLQGCFTQGFIIAKSISNKSR